MKTLAGQIKRELKAQIHLDDYAEKTADAPDMKQLNDSRRGRCFFGC
jgi:hypothetical protein